jgi:predicted phosphodiesterase
MATIHLFSDVHSNLPALDAVLPDMDRRLPDMHFCLGDLVGYTTWPNEVVGFLWGGGIPTIAGNCDEGVGLNSDDCGCAYKTPDDEARGAQSIAFTNSIISDDARTYLRGLPRHLRLTHEAVRSRSSEPLSVLMVHGSPHKVNQYLFEDFPERGLHRMLGEAGSDRGTQTLIRA